MVCTYNGILFDLKKKEILKKKKKKKEILTPATTQMNLEDIMLREISQSETDKYYVFPFI